MVQFTTTANPGNVVVPLSAIMDQLKGKLSSSEIDALLNAIISGKKTQVRPGDLIDAALINQMLGDIADLEVRVAQLEAGQSSTPGLILISPNNGDQFQVGKDMTIIGTNLGVTKGSAAVTFNGVLATTFRPGATDQKLTVLIPNIASLDPSGSTVALVVSNGESSAQRLIGVRPAQALTGAIDVVWAGVSPNPIIAGQAATFDFKLSSRANSDATFTVTPIVSRVANANDWQAVTSVINTDGSPLASNSIPVSSGGTAILSVRIGKVPSVTSGTTFALSLGAQAGAVSGNSGRVRLVTGTAIAFPDTTIVSAIDAVAFSPAGSGRFVHDADGDTIHVAPPNGAGATLVVTVRQAGTYFGRIVPLQSPDAPTDKWSLTRHPQDPADNTSPGSLASMFVVTEAQLQAGVGTVSLSPRFVVVPSQGASPAGEAEISVERQGSGLKRSIVVGLTTSP